MLICQGLDNEWEFRSKTRSQEILTVSEVLRIFTEDDAQDFMAKSVTLLQERSSTEFGSTMRAARSNAASVFRRVAQEPVFDTDELFGHAAGPRALRADIFDITRQYV